MTELFDVYGGSLPSVRAECGQALLVLVQKQTEMYQIAHQ
jgi:hypothetical protein